MKIYTKTGDKGDTMLFGGARVPKHHLRVETYGTIDELNSYLGLIIDLLGDDSTHHHFLRAIQSQLFTIGSHVATAPEKYATLKLPLLDTIWVTDIEQEIDRLQAMLSELTTFILPGGHPTISHIHIARCITRRAERLLTALEEENPVPIPILAYTNRLSDYLFTLARAIAKEKNTPEIPWKA